IILLAARRSIYLVPLAAFPVVFPCAYYLTLALPRYRLPIDPVVMLLAAIAIAGIFRIRFRLASGKAAARSNDIEAARLTS
ncbi:MAG TPA: hypothetical protein VN745_10945, partial [Verrucomicrobiae bacterium]|nr:hypothetical protein [Verrucomicrobiae bacterium]